MNYWISPEGTIIKVDVKDHYTKVCCCPDRFEIARDRIAESYKAGKKGQVALMNLLLERGWIRVTDKGGAFLVEFDKWSLSHRGHIRTWMAREGGAKVYLVSLDGKYNKTVDSRQQL
jgi:hypothetical protein